jgi:adenosylcobinamide kinase/adenosylcobinamide-phosphate guanylyltransferase
MIGDVEMQRDPWRRILVLGGAASGKSGFAESLAAALSQKVVYAATAIPVDREMEERITRHRARRPRTWQTVESPMDVAAAVASQARGFDTILLEDVAILTSNHLLRLAVPDAAHLGPERVAQAAQAELDLFFDLESHLVFVSAEVGMDLVPPNAMGRAFREVLGRINQALAAQCQEVYLVVAGLPLRLKPAG